MSGISGVGGASSAWPEMSSARAQMKDRLFSKVDTDGSGSVDKSELQSMLDDIAKKTGATAQSADALFGKLDTDGDGSISKDELDAGMKSLMPKPASTIAFAQQSAAPQGPQPGPPPGTSAATDNSSSTSSSTATDPLDTNGDGVVSAAERAAGDLKALLGDILGAADSNGDQKVTSREAEAFVQQLGTAIGSSSTTTASSDTGTSGDSSASRDSGFSLGAFTALMLKQYEQASSGFAQQAAGSSLSVAA